MSVLIFEVGILSIGSDPTPSGHSNVPKNIAYYLVAFLVGYREATFRELVKRLGDVVLKPKPADASAPTISAVTPPAGPAAGGQTVAITGAGLVPLVAVRIGATEATPVEAGETHIIGTTPAAGPGVVPITVETGETTLAAQYEYR